MRSLGFVLALPVPLLLAGVSVALGQPSSAAGGSDGGAQDGALAPDASAASATAIAQDAGAQDAAQDAAPQTVAQDAAAPDATPQDATQGAAPTDNASAHAAAPDAGAEAPQVPSDVGVSLGLHVGYALPFGRLKDVAISDVVSGAVPVGIDVGYTVEPRFYIGAYFSYAYALAASSAASICPQDPNDSCSADWFRFGAAAHWHFLPKEKFDPWAGLTLGYEVLNVSESNSDGTTISSAPSHGFEVGMQGGVDYKPKSFYGFGPYLELSGGHYWGGQTTVFHGWFGLGVRLRTGL